MSLPRDLPEDQNGEVEKLDLDALESIFKEFEKKRSAFAVGVEHERFLVQPKTLLPAPWSGSQGISQVLTRLFEHYRSSDASVSRVMENDEIIGVLIKNAAITVEPGGQLELSGAPLKEISEIDKELTEFESAVDHITNDLGLSSLRMGFHPTAKRENFDWVPKERYAIMRAYMPKKGRRGHDMMLRTCTVQANFDYGSEGEMVSSFRVALLASPIITALFAASPFFEGQRSEFLTERTPVWHETDADRCGFPLEVFESNFSYGKWIKRALRTPMYFIRRDGHYIDATGCTFQNFMDGGLKGHAATRKDFIDHLTTLFTDARIKPQLEVRGADCGPRPMLRALPALWKGILYDEHSQSKALNLLSHLSPKSLKLQQLEAARHGLNARLDNKKLLNYAIDLFEMAQDGLERLGGKNSTELAYLKPLEKILQSERNVAQLMLEKYAKGHSFDWLSNAEQLLESL